MNITFEASRGVGIGAAAVEILHPETLAAFVGASPERERLARILAAEDFAGQTDSLSPAGGTGFGLRMLVDYLAKTRTFA